MRKEKIDEILIKFEFFFEKFGFENRLKSKTYMSYHKNNFSNDFAEKAFQNFQNLCFFETRLIESILRSIEM